ncbi:hypothetical protein MHBO_003249 [Bonamia ostreae]|uniref:Dolichol-phosphate mannosyltransferase subunit 3 n=1 Tax=Bonamia ostreae TaxID=126728 RepID=A0ABV2AQF8_9EUKA
MINGRLNAFVFGAIALMLVAQWFNRSFFKSAFAISLISGLLLFAKTVEMVVSIRDCPEAFSELQEDVKLATTELAKTGITAD